MNPRLIARARLDALRYEIERAHEEHLPSVIQALDVTLLAFRGLRNMKRMLSVGSLFAQGRGRGAIR